MPNPPVLKKPIPSLVVNEGAAWGPLNLNDYITSDEESGSLRFTAELTSGEGLPNGLICTSTGTLSGIPAPHTQGGYDILITASNDSELPLLTEFHLTIKERIAMDMPEDVFAEFKSRVWEALGKDLPLPEMGDILNRPITAQEVYYLLQRWATLTIWDVYNLDPPSEKHLLNLPDISPHYVAYDRGSCLVVAPKDLFSYERTLEDALQSSRALAREAFKRSWVIEFAGFDKMARAAWVELQLLSEAQKKPVEILHFEPSAEDLKIFAERSRAATQRFAPE